MKLAQPNTCQIAVVVGTGVLAAICLPFRTHAVPPDTAEKVQNVSWPSYGGNKMGQRYSALTQINRENVSRLHLAWTWDTGEKAGLQTQPLIVGRQMFVYTPSQKIAALDGATGKLVWSFD